MNLITSFGAKMIGSSMVLKHHTRTPCIINNTSTESYGISCIHIHNNTKLDPGTHILDFTDSLIYLVYMYKASFDTLKVTP